MRGEVKEAGSGFQTAVDPDIFKSTASISIFTTGKPTHSSYSRGRCQQATPAFQYRSSIHVLLCILGSHLA